MSSEEIKPSALSANESATPDDMPPDTILSMSSVQIGLPRGRTWMQWLRRQKPRDPTFVITATMRAGHTNTKRFSAPLSMLNAIVSGVTKQRDIREARVMIEVFRHHKTYAEDMTTAALDKLYADLIGARER